MATTTDADLTAADVAWDVEPLVDGKGEVGVDELLDEADRVAASVAERRGTVAQLDAAGLAGYAVSAGSNRLRGDASLQLGVGVATQTRHAAVVELQNILALKGEALRPPCAAAGQQVHDRERRHRLAATRFAHQAMGLAGRHGERGAAHGRGAAETNLQMLDLEKGGH